MDDTTHQRETKAAAYPLPSSRRQTTAMAAAALLALALVAALVTRTSQAAFTASTDNTGNYFNAGTVSLSDNDGTTALFTVDGMEPGDVETRCIQLSYDGTITTPSAVKVYSGGYTNVGGTAGLSDYLEVTIDEGTGTTFPGCGDFVLDTNVLPATDLTTFGGTYTGYGSGVGTWTPAATGETRAYRVTVELLASTPDAEQGAGTTDVAFVWEVQN